VEAGNEFARRVWVGSSIFKLSEEQILMDSQIYFFRKTSIFNFAYRKTPEMGSKKSR